MKRQHNIWWLQWRRPLSLCLWLLGLCQHLRKLDIQNTTNLPKITHFLKNITFSIMHCISCSWTIKQVGVVFNIVFRIRTEKSLKLPHGHNSSRPAVCGICGRHLFILRFQATVQRRNVWPDRQTRLKCLNAVADELERESSDDRQRSLLGINQLGHVTKVHKQNVGMYLYLTPPRSNNIHTKQPLPISTV